MKQYINISEQYGDPYAYNENDIIDAYKDLNPDGDFSFDDEFVYEDGDIIAVRCFNPPHNRHEIEIYGDVTISEIADALQSHQLSFEFIGEDAGNIWVDLSDVSEAVNVINTIGYQTDEDE